jgi:hypothetical protein
MCQPVRHHRTHADAQLYHAIRIFQDHLSMLGPGGKPLHLHPLHHGPPFWKGKGHGEESASLF